MYIEYLYIAQINDINGVRKKHTSNPGAEDVRVSSTSSSNQDPYKYWTISIKK